MFLRAFSKSKQVGNKSKKSSESRVFQRGKNMTHENARNIYVLVFVLATCWNIRSTTAGIYIEHVMRNSDLLLEMFYISAIPFPLGNYNNQSSAGLPTMLLDSYVLEALNTNCKTL